MAYDTKPSLNFTYSYKEYAPPDIDCNGTTYVVNYVRYCNYSAPNITIIQNNTIIYVKEGFTKGKPQYAIYCLLAVIVLGVLTYSVVLTIEQQRSSSKKNEPKVIHSALTDYELAPIEKQILDP